MGEVCCTDAARGETHSKCVVWTEKQRSPTEVLVKVIVNDVH